MSKTNTMKTIEFEATAQEGIIQIPSELHAYANARVRVSILIEAAFEQPIIEQPEPTLFDLAQEKMPDSSETIDTIERMKHKISEQEQLGAVYEKQSLRPEIDPMVEKKINEILDTEGEKKRQAVEELKKRLGL